jgi:hypothetical protein
MSQQACPRCGNQSDTLSPVDQGFRNRLAITGYKETIPNEVCANCLKELESNISRGSVLLAQEKAKEDSKLALWKSRVNLLKKARVAMAKKAFSEAATSYEKYIKVLELILETKEKDITPELFKERAATKELTVVANTYWDLLRIYDTSDKYKTRQQVAARKLAQFISYTPVAPDILKKAENFQRVSRNPAIVADFLKQAGMKKGRCFIATATFSDSLAPEVIAPEVIAPEIIALRCYRDYKLRKTKFGKILIYSYYKLSPAIARWIDRHPRSKPIFKKVLRSLIKWLY